MHSGFEGVEFAIDDDTQNFDEEDGLILEIDIRHLRTDEED